MFEPSISWTEPSGLHPLRLDSSFYHNQYVQNERELRSCSLTIKRFSKVTTRIFKGAFYVLSSEYTDSGVPFLRILDIKPGFVDARSCVYLPQSLHEREAGTEVTPGNLIVAKTGASIGYSAIIPEWLSSANICQDLVGVRLKDELDPYFAQAFISSIYGRLQADRWRQGNAHPHLGISGVREWIITIPSREIQMAIGNKVRKSERLREIADDRNQLIRQAVREFVGEPPAASSELTSWVKCVDLASRLDSNYFGATVVKTVQVLRARHKTVRLGSLVSSINTGHTPDDVAVDNGIVFFASGCLAENYIRDEPSQAVSQRVHERQAQSHIATGDILLAKDGNSIGRLAVVPEWINAGNVNEHTYVIRFKQSNHSIWLHAFLTTDWGQRQIHRESVGSAQAGLGRGFVDRVRVVLPDDKDMLDDVQSRGQTALNEMRESNVVMRSAQKDVIELVRNSSVENVLSEAVEIQKWLEANPSPRRGV